VSLRFLECSAGRMMAIVMGKITWGY